SDKITQIRQLEALGGNVFTAAADVADPVQMKSVLSRAEERFGPVNGVIHAAGLVKGDSFKMVRNLSETETRAQFRAKVHGTFVLEQLFKGKNLDFCLLISSISTVLGGLTFAAYSAANCFMDAFTHQYNRLHRQQWTCVDWDGMEAEKTVKAFKRILALAGTRQVAVSRGGNLEERMAKWVTFETSPLSGTEK
ncbi:MAG: SDR family NAD(P)-dependent oxidoreductase, partial [bacterium]|nr:SDR family NAD(P)-dependent oxidoreductase [bacterium]